MNWQEFLKENKDWIHAEKNLEDGTVEFISNCYNEALFIISEYGFALKSLFLSKPHEQVEAVRFLAQKPKEWFKGIEPKYFIIIGKDADDDCGISFYKKCYENRYFIAQGNIGDLRQKECEFTQEEIDDLKSHLPENMEKIVDLAKVEVKDE